MATIKKYVFISYKAEEYDTAKKFTAILKKHNMNYWIAPDCIPSGSDYADGIAEAIDGCSAFVILLSEKSQKSEWVKNELKVAKDLCQKPIFPVYIEDCKLSTKLAIYIMSIQDCKWLKHNSESELKDLLYNLAEKLGLNKPKTNKKVVLKESIEATPHEQPEVSAVEEPKTEDMVAELFCSQKYVEPEIALLNDYTENIGNSEAEVEYNKSIIEKTLAYYKIKCQVENVVFGPTVSRYDINGALNEVKKIVKLSDELAFALRNNNVKVYLNYEQGAVSVEIPNKIHNILGLKKVVQSSTFIDQKPNELKFALGCDVTGNEICPNLLELPHLLISGATGTGKSVSLHSLIISLLFKYSPNDLRLIFIDLKKVELSAYGNLPHLLGGDVISDTVKAVKAICWARAEMERRFKLFMQENQNNKSVRNISEYNDSVSEEQRLPRIVIIIDELNDLMLYNKTLLENFLVSILQKARACGIHVILTTQRPTVDILTGTIRANIPSRIAFKVASAADSITVLNKTGAEHLMGCGDMYYRSPYNLTPIRIQGCFISAKEINNVVSFIKRNNTAVFNTGFNRYLNGE